MDQPEIYEYHCRMCDEDKKVTVRIEIESGEFGSILSSWPEFDVEPPCLGFVGGDDDGVDLMRKVTSDMDVDFERCAERCSFQYEEAWDNPDGAWVLGMNQERAHSKKVKDAS